MTTGRSLLVPELPPGALAASRWVGSRSYFSGAGMTGRRSREQAVPPVCRVVWPLNAGAGRSAGSQWMKSPDPRPMSSLALVAVPVAPRAKSRPEMVSDRVDPAGSTMLVGQISISTS